MKYLVRMDVSLPTNLDVRERTELLEREKAYAQQLQRDGVWVHLWRVVGQYANYSIFDVGDHDHLHRILQDLPLFSHMDISVTPLATHPSALS